MGLFVQFGLQNRTIRTEKDAKNAHGVEGGGRGASPSLVTQTNGDSAELENSSVESPFLFKKLCSMPYFVHIRVIKAKIKTQKTHREFDVF